MIKRLKLRAKLFLWLLLTFTFLSNDSIAGVNLGVERYVQSLKTFKASFLQYNPDGSVSSGVLYIDKPRYMRLEYHHPDKIIVNINGPFVTYYDKELDQAMNVPISNSLRNALRGNYQNISRNFHYRDGTIYVEIDNEDYGKIVLRFSVEPVGIEGFDILHDGNNIQVLFSDVSYNIPIDNRIFSDFN